MGKTKLPLWNSEFSKEVIELSRIKIGLRLIATIDDRGWPHITMISFNEAKTPDQVIWGQFIEGESKKNVLKNPKQGSFYMTGEPPFIFAQAKIHYDYLKHEGEDCDHFSRSPLLRYMTYTNVHTVYYNKVVAVTPIRKLSIIGVVKGMILNLISKGAAKSKDPDEKIGEVGMKVFNDPMSGKFLSYIDPSDGYPIILPCLQLRAIDSSKLIFNLAQFKDEFLQIKEGAHVSVYGVLTGDIAKPELVNQMINGRLKEFKKFRGVTYGIIEIDEIYNSMPPLAGVIYPPQDKRNKITQFAL